MPRTRMLTSTRAGRTVVQVQKWPKRLPNINLTGQRNTEFQNKRKSTVLYTTTSLSNFGVSKYTPFIIVKMHKNANFSKTIFNLAICLFYYFAMHYRQHRLKKSHKWIENTWFGELKWPQIQLGSQLFFATKQVLLFKILLDANDNRRIELCRKIDFKNIC